MMKLLFLVTFMVYCASAERISNVESPTWNRRTTDAYDRSNSYGSDDVSIRDNDRYGSVTDRPGHKFTYSWERDGATRSYGGGRQTDRWGDVIGEATTPRRSWQSDLETTDRWGSRTTDRYGSGSSWDRTTPRYGSGSAYDRHTSRSWGSGSSGSKWDADSTGLGSSRDRFDRNNAYVRIIVELLKLTNEKGVTIDGGKCDTFGQCDPAFKVWLDTERPNAEWPGARDSKHWPQIFQVDDNNSPDIRNGTIQRDVCGVPYRDAVLRVLVEDRDGISANDIINHFECSINRDPESSETLASWHSGTCTSKKQSDQMTLKYRYKIHQILKSRCDPNIGGWNGASTPRPNGR